MAHPLGVAVGGVEALGPGREAAQVALETLQLGDPLADLVGPALQQRDHMGAGGFAAFAESDDLADLAEGQPDGLGGSDEGETVDHGSS